MTTYVYDGDRLVRSVTVREPEFDEHERVLQLAASRRVVGDHGIPLDVAMDPANQFAFKAPKKPLMDWAEKAQKDDMDSYYATRPKGESRNGHRWGPVKFNGPS